MECGICLEEYPEGDLQLHLAMCVVRLVFRCALCGGDYMSKEGLWNHLDLHEIAEESKDLHYQEIKAPHKLHQCTLCNDQRAYSESPYWKHVHHVHDGFFLRCSECGENFRSEKLKNDHSLSYCKARDRSITSKTDDLESVQKISNIIFPIKAEKITSNVELSREEQSNKAIEGNDIPLPGADSRQNEYSRANLNADVDAGNTIVEKEIGVSPIDTAEEKDFPSPVEPFVCHICEITFSSYRKANYHKRIKHGRLQKCPHCPRIIQKEEYQAHLALCAKNRFPCELCDSKFQASRYLTAHMKRVHSDNGSSIDEEPRKEQSSVLPFACDICKSTFSSYAKADYHKIMNHAEGKYDCATCSKKFYWKKHHYLHSKVCDAVQVETKMEITVEETTENLSTVTEWDGELILTDRSDPDVATENLAGDNGSCNKCSHCGKKLSSAVTLSRHILNSHVPVPCKICGITLSSLAQAQYHKKIMHKESRYKCPYCSRNYLEKKRLQNHVSKCVDNTVPCDLCGLMFKNRTTANEHKKRFCRVTKASKKNQNDSFSEQEHSETIDSDLSAKDYSEQKSNLHQEKTSDIQEETDSSNVIEKMLRPLLETGLSGTNCSYCGKEFSNIESLYFHITSVHEVTKCDICGITFTNTSRAKYHKSLVHNSKYKCPHCSMKFFRKYRLQRHVFRCVDLKVSCERCGRKFKDLNAVNDHKKRVCLADKALNEVQEQGQKKADAFQLTCPQQYPNKHDNSQFGEEISFLQDENSSSGSCMTGEYIGIKMEIQVEDTAIQEQESQVPNDGRGKSSSRTSTSVSQFEICKHPQGSISKTVASEDTDYKNGISIKEERPEEEETLIVSLSTTEPF
ncbi:zinc finger protein 208-like [Ochlerotatus camptorhynchus]|uniref:zinc finger protein 208-like n=1 Tax=Ochlerotatus camptorhynchus TaxID=644619 RepID=UPI0031D19944